MWRCCAAPCPTGTSAPSTRRRPSAPRGDRGSFHGRRLAPAPLEPRGCLADYDADRDHLSLWCSSQDPHRPLRELEAVLGRPEGGTRVVVPDVGGAFGGKGMLQPE